MCCKNRETETTQRSAHGARRSLKQKAASGGPPFQQMNGILQSWELL
eukprot:CAMPEP_0183460824 /NCGR_PEP_ID=MMETSP0370-20130417/138421_1 /TAXON_ID=268820 /ORGANISM="Peridinium aciculiferum, Strain PAER-2" /LENGTH=46 /DNA_ID= /DNA_START= /DNA_END= /DNA_ORIENTATION=